MANPLAIAFGFVTVGVVLATILGAVERREKFTFVAGVVLLVLGSILGGSQGLSSAIGSGVALLGFVVLLASTVPLLRQSPTTS